MAPHWKGKGRPLGVYAPPHLREELTELAKNRADLEGDCLASDAQSSVNDTKVADDRRGPSSEQKGQRTKKVVSNRRQSGSLKGETRSLEWPKVEEEIPLNRVDGAEKPSACSWETLCTHEAPQDRTEVAKFERDSEAEGWLQWLERLVSSAEIQMDGVVALYLDGLLKMETEEGPEEKKEGLAEFLEAMLPTTSSCIEQGADQSKLGVKGAQREHFVKGQKVAWLVENIWDAWISWGQESSQWPEAEGTEDKEAAGVEGEEEKGFGAWLTERMWGLGLDAEVCAPYVTGLLELDEGGSAIEDFLADAALQTEAATLCFDPKGTTEEILFRYKLRNSTSQVASKSTDWVQAGPGPEKGPKKGKKKRKEKVLSVDLFSHWWTSDSGADWGTTAAALEDDDQTRGEAWGDDLQWSDSDIGNRAESWGADECAFGSGASEPVFTSKKATKRPSSLESQPSGLGSKPLSGAGYVRSAGKPPTSVVVARRMILHVLGLKDPNRRKH